jgi:hypothetical protein
MRKVFERTALIFSFVLLCIVPFLEAAPIIGQWIKPLSVIAISLAALVGFELAKYFDVSEYREDNRKLMNLVDRVERSMGCNASLVKLPREVGEYVRLWSGFTGTYYAYNPCYKVESKVGMSKTQIATEVFVERYKNEASKEAHYLFFTQDQEGKKDLEKFKELMKIVLKQCPAAKHKVQAKEHKGKRSDHFPEFYCGTKQGVSTSILEPKGALTSGRGTPTVYFVITDKTLNDLLENQFNQDWEGAGTELINLDPIEG